MSTLPLKTGNWVNPQWRENLLFFNPHLRIYDIFIDLRRGVGAERERERERNIHQLPMHVARCVPWPGIKRAAFWWMGWCSNQLSQLARVIKRNLKMHSILGDLVCDCEVRKVFCKDSLYIGILFPDLGVLTSCLQSLRTGAAFHNHLLKLGHHQKT